MTGKICGRNRPPRFTASQSGQWDCRIAFFHEMLQKIIMKSWIFSLDKPLAGNGLFQYNDKKMCPPKILVPPRETIRGASGLVFAEFAPVFSEKQRFLKTEDQRRIHHETFMLFN